MGKWESQIPILELPFPYFRCKAPLLSNLQPLCFTSSILSVSRAPRHRHYLQQQRQVSSAVLWTLYRQIDLEHRWLLLGRHHESNDSDYMLQTSCRRSTLRSTLVMSRKNPIANVTCWQFWQKHNVQSDIMPLWRQWVVSAGVWWVYAEVLCCSDSRLMPDSAEASHGDWANPSHLFSKKITVDYTESRLLLKWRAQLELWKDGGESVVGNIKREARVWGRELKCQKLEFFGYIFCRRCGSSFSMLNVLAPNATTLGEMTQNNGQYAVHGHPRSPLWVPIDFLLVNNTDLHHIFYRFP